MVQLYLTVCKLINLTKYNRKCFVHVDPLGIIYSLSLFIFIFYSFFVPNFSFYLLVLSLSIAYSFSYTR